MTENPTLPITFAKVQLPALIVGCVALAATLIAAFISPEHYFRSYLFAYLFFLGLALGSMGMTMVSQLIRGEWGQFLRRFQEAASMTLPLLAILFIPIFFGMKGLYEWTLPEGRDAVVLHRGWWMTVPRFVIFSIGYFVIWTVMAFLLEHWSRKLDDRPDMAVRDHLKKLSAGGLVVYFVTMTFAGVDWIMSREAHYYSTVFGFIMVVGQALSSFALAIVMLGLLADRKPIAGKVKPTHFNDMGSILLTLVILYAYMSFSQFLVNWAGNSQEEITWYVQRTYKGWKWLELGIIIIHFFIPFFLLLSRFNKQKKEIIGSICVLLLIARMLDLFWMVAPSGHGIHPPLRVYWTDFVAPIGIGGIWLAAFLWILGHRPLLPHYGAGLPEIAGHGEAAPGSVA